MRPTLLLCVVAVMWGIVACTGESTPTATPRPNDTPVPTAPAPTFREPKTRITAENASQLQAIGRLDNTASAPSTVFAHSFSADGTRLVGLNNDLIIMWSLTNGKTAFTRSRGTANRVYFGVNKDEFYTVATDGFITVYSVENGAVLNQLTPNVLYEGTNAHYAPNGWLALGGRAGNIQVWDVAERRSKVTFQAHDVSTNTLTFSQDGTLLASSGGDGFVRVWDWQTRTLRQEINVNTTDITALAIAPDNASIAIGTDAYAETYALTDSTLRFSIAVGVGGTQNIFSYSPNGAYLVSGGGTVDLTVMDANSGTVVAQLNAIRGDRVSAIFSPDSDLMVTTALNGNVSLWNIAQATDNAIPSARLLVGSNRITSSAWTEDGFLLAFFDSGGSVFLWGIP